MFCQFNSASKIWLSLKPTTNSGIQFWKSFLKEANPLQIISDLYWKLNYMDLCIWRMLLFCKDPNASINGEDLPLQLFFPQKPNFCTFLILRIGTEENCIKTKRNIIFSKQTLWLLMASMKIFFTVVHKEPILQGKTSELVSKFCMGYEWGRQWVCS